MKLASVVVSVLGIIFGGSGAAAKELPSIYKIRMCAHEYLRVNRPVPSLETSSLSLEKKIETLYPSLIQACGANGLDYIQQGTPASRFKHSETARKILREEIRRYLVNGSRSKQQFIKDLLDCSRDALVAVPIELDPDLSRSEQLTSVRAQVISACQEISDELILNKELKGREDIAREVVGALQKDIENFVDRRTNLQKSIPPEHLELPGPSSDAEGSGLI